MEIEKFQELKDQAKRAENELAKAKGLIEDKLATLKSKFDCDDLKQAKVKERESQEKYEKLKSEFDREVEKFKTKLDELRDKGLI